MFAAPLGDGELDGRRQRPPGASACTDRPARCRPARCARRSCSTLRAARAAARAHLRLRPRRRLRAAGRPGRADEGASSRGVQLRASSISGKDRERAAGRSSERRGWTQPVAVDRDGAVVNLYGVGVLPGHGLRPPGGVVRETGSATSPRSELRAKARRLQPVDELDLRDGLGRARPRRGVPPAGLVVRCRARGAAGADAAGGQGAPAHAREPLHRRQGRAHAPGAGALGLPRVLPPGRHRPRRPPHAGRAGRPRPA